MRYSIFPLLHNLPPTKSLVISNNKTLRKVNTFICLTVSKSVEYFFFSFGLMSRSGLGFSLSKPNKSKHFGLLSILQKGPNNSMMNILKYHTEITPFLSQRFQIDSEYATIES
ncbi:hypothetical protein ABFX02_10G026800 [Erythranthe guttata]